MEELIAISIHVPTRGTTTSALRIPPRWDFNPRAHEGHDVRMVDVFSGAGFQSTCPRGARLSASDTSSIRLLFQSTCPRGARRKFRKLKAIKDRISIHVPTRGTTLHRQPGSKNKDFNPRAHEGHDFFHIDKIIKLFDFNPRAHEGHDLNHQS